jgi:flavin reductase (DIM6/NTAB) family NADH-FMN oxidoreductase RutF
MEAGLISIEEGLISIEDGLISMEAGLISIETSGDHDVYILKFHDCNSYLKYLV